eukprot:778734-Prymnesium_polylepis.2
MQQGVGDPHNDACVPGCGGCAYLRRGAPGAAGLRAAASAGTPTAPHTRPAGSRTGPVRCQTCESRTLRALAERFGASDFHGVGFYSWGAHMPTTCLYVICDHSASLARPASRQPLQTRAVCISSFMPNTPS